MLKNTASLDLVEFVETQILPQYARFDDAHNTAHVVQVIRKAIDLAQRTGADIDMVYAIAAYHDLGLSGPRAIHHMTGGKILSADLRLKRWFSAEQINIMKEAVEDHRASASRTPRSLYGKIIAEADRDLTPETVLRMAVRQGLANYPEKSKEEHWSRFKELMASKYAPSGHVRIWVPGSANEQHLKRLRDIIATPERLRSLFEQYYQEAAMMP